MLEMIGIVQSIIFKNEENGYTVAKIKELKNSKDEITIVGTIPFLVEGQNLKIKGEWSSHPTFGKQLKVLSCEEIVPKTLIGIEKYLSSGIISGIGPVTARKIIDHFKEETLDILDNDIDRLKEIEGIGEKKIKLIYESYSRQREVRNIMIFLQPYGITANQCVKIYNKYGTNAIEILKQNPYKMVEDISGMGFKTADKIALNLGLDKNSSYRIKSGIKYVVNEFCLLGNTYMPMDELLKRGESILCVNKDEIEKNIFEVVVSGNIKVENIDGVECVFTIPYYYSELSVTKKVLSLTMSSYDKINIDVEEEIKSFEKENNIKFAPSQKEAICGAFESGMEIITGGPGTGKTTIINCIIRIFENAGMTVTMGAPTGRAAKRMTEATNREAKTIHRLLEIGYSDDDSNMQFFKSEEEPLESNVVIIDEASMIDIMLMNNLLKAVSLGTRVIIVGDVDQLPSVGPGNVLRDLIESKSVKVVRLKEIFRQGKESMIVVNAHKINNGEMPIINKKNNDFYFLRCGEMENVIKTILDLISERLPKFNENWNNIRDIQILSPTRKGILGVENLNKSLQSILNKESKNKKEKEFRDTIFRVGDKVMQIKNNYSMKWTKIDNSEEGIGVYNGDIGYITDIDDSENLIVLFDDEKRVKYDNVFLDELNLAYAITIHKSQGSEFPVVIIPMFMGPPMLMNKNLLYTGITRAKKMAVLVGQEKALSFMVKNDRSFERYSSLRWRICSIMEDF
ncbi:ATP-dependent RecD-like DNA helicase [Hathewaya histolytica]|uniref:ATP-dependent RecD2 DNA helicase n=1 Tax=Hathewaya histolytica TaxID=1498 RepID=A0A4U9RSW9_HATHI|nr:ATP-dependent RecD-like DNA helicase [Hathewaya histolytica]VTQ94063.1 recombinase D [Hathewaya histolytica]